MQMASHFVKTNGKDVCGSILIDTATKDSAEADPRLKFISLEPIHLKGKANLVNVYHVYYPHTDLFFKSPNFLNDHLIETGSMVVQMNEIKKRLAKLTQSEPQNGTIMITGDIGTGKTMMLEKIREFINSRQLQNHDTLSTDSESANIDFSREIIICDGKADNFNQTTRCFVWKQLIYKLLHHTNDEKKNYFIQKIEKEHLFSRLPENADEIDFNSRECELVVRVINSLTNPLLLLIDQCQWMSDRDWQICYYIATTQRSEAVLMVMATRPLHSDRYAPAFNPICKEYFQLIQLPETSLIQLDTYDLSDVKTLIQSEIGVKHISKEALYMVDRYTGGNPLYICKWLKALKAEDMIAVELDDETRDKVLIVKQPKKDNNNQISLPIPYRITRTISTYLDRLKPMEFLLLKTAAVIATGGGCLTGCFELAFAAQIFPKKVVNDDIAKDFLELINTLQLFSLITPYTLKDVDKLQCIQTCKVLEPIEPLKNRFFTFTAIVTRDIIYHKMLHDQRKRIHTTALDYIRSNLINYNVPDEDVNTYRIHYYRHLNLSGDISGAKKIRHQLLNEPPTPTNTSKSSKVKLSGDFKKVNSGEVSKNDDKKPSLFSRLFSCFSSKKIKPIHNISDEVVIDKAVKDKADKIVVDKAISDKAVVENEVKNPIQTNGFTSKKIPLQESPHNDSCSNRNSNQHLNQVSLKAGTHQPQPIQSHHHKEENIKPLTERSSMFSMSEGGGYLIDEIMSTPLDEDTKELFKGQDFISDDCVIDRVIGNINVSVSKFIDNDYNRKGKSSLVKKSKRAEDDDDKNKRIIKNLGFGDNKEVIYLYLKLDTWDFDVFNCNSYCNNEGLKFVASSIFQQRKLLSSFNIPLDVFHKFLLNVEAAYHQDNPYHNAMHVIDVLQTVNCFLSVTKAEKHLNDIDIFSLLVAAMLHDIDHPGVSYDFLVKTEDPRTLKYNFKWCLEAYHADLGIEYMNKKINGYAIFDYFTETEKIYMTDLIKHLILFTSLEFNSQFIKDFREFFPNNKVNYENEEARKFIMTLFIKASDISNPAKPFSLYKSWANALIQENYKQGDKEKELGMTISPNMERGKADIAIIQMKFMRFMVHPLYFAFFDYFASVRDLCKSLLASNFAFWASQEKAQEERKYILFYYSRRKSVQSRSSSNNPAPTTVNSLANNALRKRASCATMVEYSKILLNRDEMENNDDVPSSTKAVIIK